MSKFFFKNCFIDECTDYGGQTNSFWIQNIDSEVTRTWQIYWYFSLIGGLNSRIYVVECPQYWIVNQQPHLIQVSINTLMHNFFLHHLANLFRNSRCRKIPFLFHWRFVHIGNNIKIHFNFLKDFKICTHRNEEFLDWPFRI